MLFCLLAGTVSAGKFFEPKIVTTPKAGMDIVISIQNNSAMISPSIYFKRVEGFILQSVPINTSTNNGTINSSHVQVEGIYEFFVNDSDGERFPASGALRLPLSFGRPVYLSKALSFTTQDADTTWSCRPNNNSFECIFEHLQGRQLDAFAQAYLLDRNLSHLNLSNALATREYDTTLGSPAGCDHADGDFNCSPMSFGVFYPETSGAKRQAAIIYSLWSAYQKGGNRTVKDLAMNYTTGSAQECDVWRNDFNCTVSEDQGFMMSAYWKAYEMTGSDDNMEKALNLTQIGFSMNNSLYLALGFWKAYEMTGNTSYHDKAVAVTDTFIGDCIGSSCAPIEHSLNAMTFLEAYKQTDSFSYRRAAERKLHANINMTNSTCNPWNNSYTCSDPEKQALAAITFWTAYQTLPNITGGFFAPRFGAQPNISTDLNISVNLIGNLTNPLLHYRRVTDTAFSSVAVSQDSHSAVIPGAVLFNQGVREFFFNDSNGNRFPSGGTLKFVISQLFDVYRKKAEKLTATDPDLFCDPLGTNPTFVNFSCRLEHMQAWMLEQSSKAYFVTLNNTYLLNAEKLSLAEIDDTANPSRHQTCDHAKDDADCNPTNPFYVADPNKRAGAMRQASLIYSLFDAYTRTSNESLYRLAIDYASGSAEECDVWSNDFNCGTSDEQGIMIAAYAKAYEMTNSPKFLEIAEDLADAGLSMQVSDYLMWGLYRVYEVTGNASLLSQANTFAGSRLDYCSENGNCSVEEQAIDMIAYWESYEQTNNASYLDAGFKKTKTRPSTTNTFCDPNNPTDQGFQCRWPHEQGIMATAFWTALETYVINENASFTTLLQGPPNASLNQEFNISCTFNNTGNFSQTDVDVTLFTDFNATSVQTSGTVSNENQTITFGSLASGAGETINWTLKSTKGGPNSISCDILTFSHKINMSIFGIGPAFGVILPEQVGRNAGEGFNVTFNITNNASFPLFNFTVSLVPQSGVNITAMVSDGTVFLQNYSVSDSVLGVGDSLTVNVSYRAIAAGIANTTVNVTSQYGGTGSGEFSAIVFEDTFGISFDSPAQALVKQDRTMKLVLQNNENFSLNNVTVELITPFNVTNVTAAGATILSNVSLVYSDMGAAESNTINWTFHATATSNLNISVQVNTSLGINTSATNEISIGAGVFSLSLSAPAEQTSNATFNISLLVANIVDYPLINVSVGLNLSDGLNASLIFNDSAGEISLDNLTIIFGQLDASLNTTINWSITGIGAGFTENISVNVTSSEGGLVETSASLCIGTSTQCNPPPPTVTEGVGGGRGGFLIHNVSYTYGDLDIYDEISKYPELLDYLNLTNEAEFEARFGNASEYLSECIDIIRRFDSGSVVIDFEYFCDGTVKGFKIYDEIPKEVARSASDMNVSAPGAEVTVLKEDPGFLFSYDELSQGQEGRISYMIRGRRNVLTRLKLPVILAEEIIFPAEEIVPGIPVVPLEVNITEVPEEVKVRAYQVPLLIYKESPFLSTLVMILLALTLILVISKQARELVREKETEMKVKFRPQKLQIRSELRKLKMGLQMVKSLERNIYFILKEVQYAINKKDYLTAAKKFRLTDSLFDRLVRIKGHERKMVAFELVKDFYELAHLELTIHYIDNQMRKLVSGKKLGKDYEKEMDIIQHLKPLEKRHEMRRKVTHQRKKRDYIEMIREYEKRVEKLKQLKTISKKKMESLNKLRDKLMFASKEEAKRMARHYKELYEIKAKKVPRKKVRRKPLLRRLFPDRYTRHRIRQEESQIYYTLKEIKIHIRNQDFDKADALFKQIERMAVAIEDTENYKDHMMGYDLLQDEAAKLHEQLEKARKIPPKKQKAK